MRSSASFQTILSESQNTPNHCRTEDNLYLLPYGEEIMIVGGTIWTLDTVHKCDALRRAVKSPASVTSVCPLSYDRNSRSILMKLCTVGLVWNPESKIEFVKPTATHPPISPNFHLGSAFSMARSEHHTNKACGRIMAFDGLTAQRTLLYGRYTGDIEEMLQPGVTTYK